MIKINLYILGILWAIGRYSEDAYYYLRCKEKYFLEVVKQELEAKSSIIDSRHQRTLEPQYKLKINKSLLPAFKLENLGWSPRLEEQRSYPKIVEHKDFLRAYMDLHSVVDIRWAWNKPKTEKVKYPRLRIYGNKHFLKELSEVLNAEIGVTEKKVQKAGESEISGILYYQAKTEALSIYDYLYGHPAKYCYQPKKDEFWEILNITNSVTK